MILNIFKAIMVTSFSGTVLTLFLVVIKPITKRYFASSWHYYMWFVVLIVMIMPIRISLPESTHYISQSASQNSHNQSTENKPIRVVNEDFQLNPQMAERTYNNPDTQKLVTYVGLNVISLFWLVGVLVIFAFKLTGYMIFLIRLRKYSDIISCPEIRNFTDTNITTRISDKISSPLMIGVIKPTLLLPKIQLTEEELGNVLAHEMTHFRRKDILYKWFVGIVKCIHWFNPVVYYISAQVDIECEISCDLSVVKEMSDDEEKCYINTILNLLCAGNKKIAALTTGMTGNKRTLKKRFTMIKNRKRAKKPLRIFSSIVSVILMITTLFASGVLATTVLEEKSDILFICNGREIDFDNKPFYENNTVYIPLRELLDEVGIMKHPNSSIEWKDGRIILNLAFDDKVTKTANFCYAIEIGKPWYIINPEDALPFYTDNPLYKQNFNRKIDMEKAPIIKGSATYVPYEFVDHFLGVSMSGLGPHGIDGPYDITCIAGGESPVAYVTPSFFFPANTKIHGSVGNSFGVRTHPVTGEKKIHNGVDIIAPEDSEVFTAIRGKVSEIGFDNELGNYVVVANKSGVSTLYAHLSSVEVSKGDIIPKKAYIGRVGKTGTATRAFLHFEIMINGVYYDPMKFWNVNPIKETEHMNNEELLALPERQENTGVSESAETNIEPKNRLKIKSETIGDELYLGFENLVLENADTDKLINELNKQGITETKTPSVDLTRSFAVKDYNSEQTKVKADKNGNISLYFSVDSDNLFDVHFYDAQTNEDVGGFSVLANNENAYTFIGFEKDKTYNMMVQGKNRNDWIIEGSYIIY